MDRLFALCKEQKALIELYDCEMELYHARRRAAGARRRYEQTKRETGERFRKT
jgi:hypothetical protein